MPWDPDYPKRRPDATEVALFFAFFLVALAAVVWGTWTFAVWTNGKFTLYDLGMPLVWIALVLVGRAIYTRADRRRARSRATQE